MKKIILPTDFSDNAKNACDYAMSLFKDEACTFYLVNTFTPVIYNYDYQMNTGSYMGQVIDTIRDNSKENLNSLKEELELKFKNKKHQFEIVSSFSLLTDEVNDLAKKENADLIVMGTIGASGLKEVLFGSNTIHVIKKATCPVLAIPNGFMFETPKEILFPTDYKVNYEDKHLYILKDIATGFNSIVNIMHVFSGRELNDEEDTNRKKLNKLLADTKKVTHNVEDQPIPQAIHNFQQETYIHLLMMIKNKHTFLENIFFKQVIHEIGFHLTVPFLVVPA
ncbi:MAG: universal stress protein [Flavobacteriales bacterium]|nr:MAG: universal stress protein [Flavobacteriales bacterium]